MTYDNHVDITSKLVADHGLKPDEYGKILQLIGRNPTLTELGIFSAMWNEHCSYKSSKKWLRTLPTEGPRVIHNYWKPEMYLNLEAGGQVTARELHSDWTSEQWWFLK